MGYGDMPAFTKYAAVRPILDRVARFADLMETDADGPAFLVPRRSESIGRPLGSETFIRSAEARLGRTLAPGKRGPKPKALSRRGTPDRIAPGSVGPQRWRAPLAARPRRRRPPRDRARRGIG